MSFELLCKSTTQISRRHTYLLNYSPNDLTKQLFTLRITMEETILTTLFIIEYEIECYLGTVWPVDERRGIGVADDIAAAPVG